MYETYDKSRKDPSRKWFDNQKDASYAPGNAEKEYNSVRGGKKPYRHGPRSASHTDNEDRNSQRPHFSRGKAQTEYGSVSNNKNYGTSKPCPRQKFGSEKPGQDVRSMPSQKPE
jgi:hypothetical protein